MQVLIFGASGFIGKNLVETLKGKFNLIGVCKSNSGAEKLEKLGVKSYIADIGNEKTFNKIPHAEIVINLVGALNKDKEELYKLHVIGLNNIIKNFDDAKKIIHVSALGCDSQTTTYFRTKFAGEKILKSSELNYTIFRPSVVYDQNSEFMKILEKLCRLPLTPIIGKGDYKIQIVNVKDLAEILADSILRRETEKKVYEIGGPEKLSFFDIIQTYKEVFEIKRGNVFIPKRLFNVAMLFSKLLGIKVSPEAIEMLVLGNLVREELTYPFLEPRIKFREFLENLKVK